MSFAKIITVFFNQSGVKPLVNTQDELKKKYNKLRWSVFISATLGYGIYYMCRLSLNVVKKPIVDSGFLTETELGIIGSALLFSLAFGKLFNGFLTDRCNIRKFLSLGLLLSSLINLALGFKLSFLLFAILWGVNGWVQSMGVTPCIIGITRWFGKKERASYYGFWSSSYSIGEFLTFILTAYVVSLFGWESGFWSAGIIGLAGVLMIWIFFKDSPESQGLPSISEWKNDANEKTATHSVSASQLIAVKNPYIWILALSSSFMYISRYAINSWGIYYLESEKAYSLMEASSIISINAIFGVIGTTLSGVISDKFFNGKRNLPALIFGIVNTISLSLLLLVPGRNFVLDCISMVLFGISMGVNLCYIGGLIAVDIAPQKAIGAVLGIIGITSYLGAGIQDIVSGYLIESRKTIVNNVTIYDFSQITYFWIGASIASFVLALFVWNAKNKTN